MEQKTYAVVVGGANMDLGAKSYQSMQPGDSNPGSVSTAWGGVGRNIAQALALLEIPVHLVAPLGEDAYGSELFCACRSQGIDMSHALVLPGKRTSCYVSLTDRDGRLFAAVSDMDICDTLTPDLFEPYLPLLNGAGAVVLEANLPGPVLEYLAEQVHVPLFCDPVSQAKAPRLKPILKRAYAIKPNRREAEILTGIAIVDPKSLDRAVDCLLSQGIQQVFLSMAERGLYCADETGRILVPPVPTEVVSDTGGGDSAMAGLVYAYLHGFDLARSGRFAVHAASLTLASDAAVSPLLGSLLHHS